jgi:mRNA-degrading endonuclease toxin of MazEF toxin-antitoxin module
MQLCQRAVVLVNLGTIRDVEGHEQALTRPCLVIKPLNVLELATVLPLSTRKPPRAAGSPVKITKGTTNLNSDSFVLIHQIRTLSHQRMIHEIGQLPIKQFEHIQHALQDFLRG